MATAQQPAATTAPPAAPAAPAQNASLYCGDLPNEITEAVLFDLFKAVGPVLSIRVCRDSVTRRSLRYAYINFQNPSDAERALETLNYHQVSGQAIRLMWCHRDPGLRKQGSGNVFIKNLQQDIDNQELYDTFSQFGNILSCKVAADSSGKSLGHGFVHFETDAAADAAIEKVNGMLLKDKKVYVAKHVRRAQRIAETQAEYTNCYVKNLKEGMTEEALTKFFESKYGKLTSVALKTDNRGRNFAFVDFESHEKAAAAVADMHEKEVAELSGEVPLYISRAQKKSERNEALRKRFAGEKAKRQNELSGHNLYVKNLDDSITEVELRAEFAKFGEITSVKVMTDDKDISRGFGFVCFKEVESANQALQTMNGSMLGAKPLYVNVAQRKEVRRATLEIQYAARMGRGGPGPNGPPGGMPFNPAMYQQHFMAPGMQPYYQGMMGGRGGMMGGRGGPMPYPPMAMGGRGGRGGRGGMPGGRGMPAGMPGRGAPGMPGMPMPGMPGAMPGNFSYTKQARNQAGANPAPGMAGAAMAGPGPQPIPGATSSASEPLTTAALANMSPEQQKNTLGERLFARINESNPEYAAKITGMLLEMDISEQLHLLEAPDMLRAKISEAMEVLRGHSS